MLVRPGLVCHGLGKALHPADENRMHTAGRSAQGVRQAHIGCRLKTPPAGSGRCGVRSSNTCPQSDSKLSGSLPFGRSATNR